MIPKQFNPNITKSYYLTRSLLLENIRRHAILLEGTVLDFGCGSKPYKSLINAVDYIGIDFKGDGHAHDNENIDLFYNGQHIPFPCNFFDSILCTEVFEHIFNLEEVLQQLHRVIKPGRFMLITCPFICPEHEVPNDCSRYTSFGIQNLLQRNGFKIFHHEKFGTSIQAQMQMFMSYLDSYVLCKLNCVKWLHKIVCSVVFASLNIFCGLLNWLLPKKYDAYLGHVIVIFKTN